MTRTSTQKRIRCAIYTRKSSEEGLEQAFNSLHAQREACEAFILSQQHEGWRAIDTLYDDGGYSGGTIERPALQTLLGEIKAGRIDIVVVYKIDRLTRSLFDFAKIVEIFDAHKVSFVSVTQSFNTTTLMGQLTLNVLLSFAQFEREVTGERIRDKVAASKKKGMWMGGPVPLGYDVRDRKLVINPPEAETVRQIFDLYARLQAVRKVKDEADRLGLRTKVRAGGEGRAAGGHSFGIGHLYTILRNPLYLGCIAHKGQIYRGDHAPIISQDLWNRVQAQLAANAQARRSGSSASDPSLLIGLLFDANDRRMTPSHAVKNGKRYRYYVSNNLITGKGSGTRIAAHEIENLIAAELIRLLGDDVRLIDELRLDDKDPAMIRGLLGKAKALSQEVMNEPNAGKRLVVQQIIDRVHVAEEGIRIEMNRKALRQLCGIEVEATEESEPIVIQVAAQLRRLGKEKKLIIAGQTCYRKPDQALVKAIARAHRWFEALKAGQVQSVSEIAARERVPRTYVSSLLRLAFLAPDIVEAVLEGHQPIELSLGRLLKQTRPPLEWVAQRTALGFANR